MPEVTNVYEELARLRKAIRLADALDAGGWTVENLHTLSRPQLTVIAKRTGVDVASTETWTEVLDLLASRKAARRAVEKL